LGDSRELTVAIPGGSPAYERLRDDANTGTRVRDILVAGVSTRHYAAALPEAAGTVGVSKSTISRRFIEASAAQLAALNERSLTPLMRQNRSSGALLQQNLSRESALGGGCAAELRNAAMPTRRGEGLLISSLGSLI
jgi:hypothetical protein